MTHASTDVTHVTNTGVTHSFLECVFEICIADEIKGKPADRIEYVARCTQANGQRRNAPVCVRTFDNLHTLIEFLERFAMGNRLYTENSLGLLDCYQFIYSTKGA